MTGKPVFEAVAGLAAMSRSATEIARAVCGLHRTAESVVLETLNLLQQLAPLNAMIHIAHRDIAIAQARRVDAAVRDGSELPLAGVPFVVKDNIATADMPTSGGSFQLREHRPQRNATAVDLLIAAGAIPVGKSNLHELAFGATSCNAGFGAVRNPHDLQHIAGGSSGGTGVAVACGLPLGLGTDTGGSIRIPAALCGVYGFRPTVHRYPSDGIMTISRTRDALGTMARGLDDLYLADALLTRRAPSSLLPCSIAGLRIGLPRRPYFEELDEGVAAAVESAIARIAAAGAELVDIDARELARLDQEVGFAIAACEGRDAWREFALRERGIELEAFTAGIRSDDVRHLFELFSSTQMFTDSDYAAAMARRERVVRWYEERFLREGLDCFLLPSMACEPPSVSASAHDQANAAAQFASLIRQASPATLGGIPSISIPIGSSSRTGLPVGLMCEGPASGDERLFAIAGALDRLLHPS